MAISKSERLDALLFAKVVAASNMRMAMEGDLHAAIRKLNNYRLFTAQEIAWLSNTLEVRVRRICEGLTPIRARSCIKAGHMDDLIRMAVSPEYTQKHIRRLLEAGATVAAIARITGHSRTSLYRWLEKGE